METYVSIALDRSAYFLIATTLGGRYYPCFTDEQMETQTDKQVFQGHAGRLQYNSWRQKTVFPIPRNKVTGLFLPYPSWRRYHHPWLQGLVGPANQGPLVVSGATIFGHQGCSAVFSILKVRGVFRRSSGKQSPGET